MVLVWSWGGGGGSVVMGRHWWVGPQSPVLCWPGYWCRVPALLPSYTVVLPQQLVSGTCTAVVSLHFPGSNVSQGFCIVDFLFY